MLLTVADDLPIACGDPGYFDQIITNLLSNAAKYGTPGEPITLTADPCEEGILVCVSNPGSVLSPQNIERLFAPFYREAKLSPLAQGVGLGLAVCRRLADAQGGHIWATARAEGGLEVNFTVPIVADES